MRRSLLVLALAAAAVLGGAGAAVAGHIFRDVPDSSVHAAGIHWASENGIVTGFGDRTFRPRTTVLRDQLATMLHRFDEHVDRKIADALPGVLAPRSEFGQTTVTLDPGGVHVPMPVYVADRPAQRQQGLMHVEHLPQEAGMLFVFPNDTRSGFHMRNTRIPLSIAFLDAGGTVLAVLDMEPCEAEPCPVYEPGVSYRGALEVNQGRFDDLGLREPGWRVDVPGGLQTTS